MMKDTLLTLSPLDGRYFETTRTLRPYLSEWALIRYRLIAESTWLEAIVSSPTFAHLSIDRNKLKTCLQQLIEQFDEQDGQAVKTLERSTHHDVKALEYFLRSFLKRQGFTASLSALVHYACTSEDINNLAYGLMLKTIKNDLLTPLYRTLIELLNQKVETWAKIPMLSHTHGQAATPTTVGKEIATFTYRLGRQVQQFSTLPILAKMNGAVGNFNAHYLASPETDWIALSQHCIESLGLSANPYTSQIEPHDNLIEHCDILSRINTILTGACRDLWGYIGLHYFVQKVQAEEVGSSTMPHKINPIDFENAEGNFGLSTALLRHFADKLPISRWQRDLSDSTVMRNIAVAFGHHYVGLTSFMKGLNKIEPHLPTLQSDLEAHPEILTEAVQTMMRRHGIEDAYEQLKSLSRGQVLELKDLHRWIDTTTLPETSKQILKDLRPETYLGLASQTALGLKSALTRLSN